MVSEPTSGDGSGSQRVLADDQQIELIVRRRVQIGHGGEWNAEAPQQTGSRACRIVQTELYAGGQR